MVPHNLQTLAQAIADDVEIDWASAEATSDPSEREAVRQLRLVASISRTARNLALTWGPFEVRETIGHGTSGTVYRAWDPKLEREVALKLLHEAPDPQAQGAIHEARLLATVEHPNIVPVYGADVHEGRAGIWMKFIHGKTLKDMLVERGPFGADEAALIGRDICSALAMVHQQGLLHRDIKAQNVMREVGGQTLLMDFGSGQRIAVAAEDVMRGTPAYLAPEVVAGAPATPQSDIYSVAVLLNHLVSGEFPVTATSWAELATKHASGSRRLLRDARPDLPEWFVCAVDQGLAANPAERPATAGAMSSLLTFKRHRSRANASVAVASAALLLAIVGFAVATWNRPLASAPSARSSVAIAPFENLTGAAELDYLGLGLAGQVGARLSSLAALRVVVPSGTIKADGGRDLATQLGVQAALACQIRGSAERVRLGCHLRDAESTHVIWASTADYRVEDVVALESEIARRVASILTGSDARTPAMKASVSPEALSLYLKGRYEWSFRTEESLNRSVNFHLAALRAAPNFALAYSGLADAYTLLGAYGHLPRTVSYARALEAAERAVALDTTLAEIHFSLGYAQKNTFKWTDAEVSFRRGLELNPDSSTGHHWFSIYLSQMGRFAEAITEAKLAISLDPSSLAARTNFATLLMMARRYRDAISAWEECVQLGSNQVNTYRAMSKAHLYVGDRARALELADAAERRVATGAANEELKADLAYIYASAGRREDALALADELELRYRTAGEGIAGSIAAIYTGLGDHDKAFTWLDAAQREQDPELGYLLVDPKWDPLRADTRFRSALVNTGFPVK
jgi:tetratricopeptide (TPR) repeat protein